MQIAIPIKEYDSKHVLFCNRADNTVIVGGGFYRAMYCNKDISILGIHVKFDIEVIIDKNNNDYRELLNNTCEKTNAVLASLVNDIYVKWTDSVGFSKGLPLQSMNFNVEPIVSKAMEPLRKTTNTEAIYRLSFVFKCSGVYDTDFDAGVSFRLNHMNTNKL